MNIASRAGADLRHAVGECALQNVEVEQSIATAANLTGQEDV